MDAVDVLGRQDRVGHGAEPDVARQWLLDDHARDSLLGVQRLDRLAQLIGNG